MGDGQNLSSVASPTIYDRFYKPQGLQGLWTINYIKMKGQYRIAFAAV